MTLISASHQQFQITPQSRNTNLSFFGLKVKSHTFPVKLTWPVYSLHPFDEEFQQLSSLDQLLPGIS